MKYLFPFLFVFVIFSCKEDKPDEKVCLIEGQVHDRDSKAIILFKALTDSRSPDTVRVPIKNQQFSTKITFDKTVAYNFIFEDELEQGSWRPIEFIPVNGTLQFKLYPTDRYEENQILGDSISDDILTMNTEFYNMMRAGMGPFYEELKRLEESGPYYSDSMKTFMAVQDIEDEWTDKGDRGLYNQLTELRNSGVAYSDEVNEVKQQIESAQKKLLDSFYERLAARNDIVSYFFLIRQLLNFNEKYDNMEKLQTLQKQMSQTFVDHPYNQLSQDLIWSHKNMQVGGDYYDFTLAGFDNQQYVLSEQIEGKYALLMFWAPWCGPCIRSNRSMIPIYEKYKEKGLTAIAVVGKYETEEEVLKIIEKDKYPWIHLLDTAATSQIWTNYGLRRAGGSIFLIDDNGKIKAVYPGANELDQILTEVLL